MNWPKCDWIELNMSFFFQNCSHKNPKESYSNWDRWNQSSHWLCICGIPECWRLSSSIQNRFQGNQSVSNFTQTFFVKNGNTLVFLFLLIGSSNCSNPPRKNILKLSLRTSYWIVKMIFKNKINEPFGQFNYISIRKKIHTSLNPLN